MNMNEPFLMLINMVVRTNITVRLTVTTASKKKSLKKFVPCPIIFKSIVGMNAVSVTAVRRRPRANSNTTTLLLSTFFFINSSVLLTKYWVSSTGPRYEWESVVRLIKIWRSSGV